MEGRPTDEECVRSRELNVTSATAVADMCRQNESLRSRIEITYTLGHSTQKHAHTLERPRCKNAVFRPTLVKYDPDGELWRCCLVQER